MIFNSLFFSDSFYHVSCTIDENGGKLSLPYVKARKVEASLVFPNGAVNGELKVSYGECMEDDYPDMEKDEMAVTPVMQCGPEGISFSKAVEITIPHSAVDINVHNVRVWHKEHNPGIFVSSENFVVKCGWHSI